MLRKEDKSVQKSVDWKAYFENISDACPWSLEAYKNDEIQFFEGDVAIRSLGKGKANLYILPDIDVDHIYELAEQLDELYYQYEFLWSHPDYTKGGNRATPVPVIIQQDKAELEYLRGNKQKKA